MPKAESQLKYIHDFLIELSENGFSSRFYISDNEDQKTQFLKAGINKKIKELKTTAVSNVSINSIYNGINDMLIVLSEKIEIQKTNQVVESVLLYPEAELLNQSIGNLIQLNDFDLVRDTIRNTYEQRKLHEIGLNLITKDKRLIPVSCSFSPLYNAQEKLSGILLVAKNITTLVNAKNQLQDKSDELNLFVYKASHDLKSPVSSMMGLMNLINNTADIDEMKTYCKMVSECIYKLDAVINDLMVLGRITYGELKYNQVDIKQTIDTILRSIEFVEGFSTIRFNIDIHDEASSITTEKELFQTVLFNLIDNAVKYRQTKAESSYISIHVSNHENGILFKIEDNGIGIDQSMHTDVFKMFYRGTYASKGSGLGLYIVKMGVLKLGGTITVESNLGKGTTFKVYIPSK